jgi:hypothetical protein
MGLCIGSEDEHGIRMDSVMLLPPMILQEVAMIHLMLIWKGICVQNMMILKASYCNAKFI